MNMRRSAKYILGGVGLFVFVLAAEFFSLRLVYSDPTNFEVSADWLFGPNEFLEARTNGTKNEVLTEKAIRVIQQGSSPILFNGEQVQSDHKVFRKIRLKYGYPMDFPLLTLDFPPERVSYDPETERYIVFWHINPDCSRKLRREEWIWVNRFGIQCAGGYSVSVVFDKNLSGEEIIVGSLR